MAPYRVLIVDDSAFMRTIIGDLILRDKQFTIVATAVNGIEAVSAITRYKPDVVTMDLEMPVMNGLQALQYIMKNCPLPVIMLSGISEANTRDTIMALEYGAFDFIRKPSGPASGDIYQVGELLRDKLRAAIDSVKAASRTVISEATGGTAALSSPETPPETIPQKATAQMEQDLPPGRFIAKDIVAEPKPLGKAEPLQKPVPDRKALEPKAPPKADSVSGIAGLAERIKKTVEDKTATTQPAPNFARPKEAPLPPKPESRPQAAGSFKHLVAIGTSTGGPRALHEVICSLPADFPAPVLVVQHMPPRFTKSLAQRLDSFSALRVVEAEQGMRATAGTVYIAPGGYHMELARDSLGYWIQLGSQPQVNGHRPSVDVMFESLVPLTELTRHAVIMTGMGSDGAKGMKSLANSGAASTIAEAEETCIVYGMPRSAVEVGCVQTVLPLQHIASRLVSAVSK
ncbi:protein-glutamate methylesterase/protein-glutamine glutaminase [Paenibacillus sp. CAU 1782]